MSRQLVFDENGSEDYIYWQSQDRKTLKRLNRLIQEALRAPFSGLGKPKPLKRVLSGAWSRRIDEALKVSDSDLSKQATALYEAGYIDSVKNE